MPEDVHRWNTGLLAHAELADPRGVERAIAKGADVNYRKGLRTSLMEAADTGNVEVAKVLLEADAHVDLRDEMGSTALFDAVFSNSGDVANLLLDAGADANICNRLGYTALHTSDNAATTQALLRAHANIEHRGFCGRTALQGAAAHGRGPLVQVLLDGGAEVNGRDDGGATALHLASRGPPVDAYRTAPPADEAHVDVVKSLLAAGANVNQSDAFGDTALHLAVETRQPSLDVVKMLVAANADVNQTNLQDETALLNAVGKNHVEVAKALLAAGAHVGRALECAHDNGFTGEITDILKSAAKRSRSKFSRTE